MQYFAKLFLYFSAFIIWNEHVDAEERCKKYLLEFSKMSIYSAAGYVSNDPLVLFFIHENSVKRNATSD